LKAGSTTCFNVTIQNIDDFAPFTSIWMSINDRNGVYPYQPQCEIDGRREINVMSCDFIAEFFANNVHHLVLPDTTFCYKNVNFRAELYPEVDSLKWFITYGGTEFEEVAARDHLTWGKSFESGTYPVRMWVRFQNGGIANITSTLVVELYWIKIRNVRH